MESSLSDSHSQHVKNHSGKVTKFGFTTFYVYIYVFCCVTILLTHFLSSMHNDNREKKIRKQRYTLYLKI